MPYKVLMPQLGESVNEGTITKWLKNKGDRIEEFEALLEINTDKVDTEIPSPATGFLLDILIEEGATIEAGTLLAWIGEPDEEIPSIKIPTQPSAESTSGSLLQKPRQEPVTPAEPAILPPAAGKDRSLGFISPVVARIASEHNVDLFKIQATGRNGRITKDDILNYLEQSTREDVPADIEIIPLSPIRQKIAEHMVRSKHTSPHVTTVMEADLRNVVNHRVEYKSKFKTEGVNLTLSAYFAFATVHALKDFQLINSTWKEEGILLHRRINIGMATSLENEGLIVPVIKNADQLSFFELSRQINLLAEKARQRQLTPDDVQGGTFTITNHGTSGSLMAMPIINQPQCAILGIGVVQKRVVVIDDAIAIRPMVYLSLTFDHRIIDGAIADHFLTALIDVLEGQWEI